MSIRKLLTVTSLVCTLPLAACEEEEQPEEPTSDASAPVVVTPDGGIWNPGPIFAGDAGHAPSTADGAAAPAPLPADGGTVPNQPNLPNLPNQPNQPNQPANDASVPNDPRDAGGSQPQPAQGARFFLPTGMPTNTAAPIVEVDRAGNTHTVYPAYAGGDAYYAFCAAGSCSGPSAAKVVQFDTDGTVDHAMIALTADGRPRVLLSTYLKIYYGECEQNCGEQASWTVSEIMAHDSNLTVDGEALALDPAGRPRFIVHARRNPYDFFTPRRTDTQIAQCDQSCTTASNWTYSTLTTKEIWEGSHLRYDATGRGHIATTVYNYLDTTQPPLTAYLTCQGACNAESTWSGTGFAKPIQNLTEVVRIMPTVSLALTKSGGPRVAMIIEDNQGKRSIGYAECDSDCAKADSWRGINLWAVDSPIGAGLDLVLDSKGTPIFAHTINYNIVLTYCQEEPCTAQGAKWESTSVEKSSDLPADTIFLEWNCTVGAWFFHSPSLALTADDQPRVGYQSRDISGGVSRPDPLKPRCTAGTDMTFSRFAVMSSYK